jgi:hypothetical protein
LEDAHQADLNTEETKNNSSKADRLPSVWLIIHNIINSKPLLLKTLSA